MVIGSPSGSSRDEGESKGPHSRCPLPDGLSWDLDLPREEEEEEEDEDVVGAPPVLKRHALQNGHFLMSAYFDSDDLMLYFVEPDGAELCRNAYGPRFVCGAIDEVVELTGGVLGDFAADGRLLRVDIAFASERLRCSFEEEGRGACLAFQPTISYDEGSDEMIVLFTAGAAASLAAPFVWVVTEHEHVSLLYSQQSSAQRGGRTGRHNEPLMGIGIKSARRLMPYCV